MDTQEIRRLLKLMGFFPLDGSVNTFNKNFGLHAGYTLQIDFVSKNIDYGKKITIDRETTTNFSQNENFVVLECVNRLLEKGYPPESITLEKKYPLGHKNKGGDLDILIKDNMGKPFLMIECKTWGIEYEAEIKKMLDSNKKGGQLFSYYQQDQETKYLCLYTSHIDHQQIDYRNSIVEVEENFKGKNTEDTYDTWNKIFKHNGIFDEESTQYNITHKNLLRRDLNELKEGDSGRIFNSFAEILRHNVVSDKSNAYNKMFNLFLCKIVDEDRNLNEELAFQWKDDDDDESLQKRLSDLYKQGMERYLEKEITDYSDEDLSEQLLLGNVPEDVKKDIKKMFSRLRLQKNNEFAFKEVFNEASFKNNAIVVKEVVKLLQEYQIRYSHKQQFLSNFFELLLTTGLKQESGQFFTPVPIAKFIVSSIPLKEIVDEKIRLKETRILPYSIDFAAGSGHFLTELMDEIQRIINCLDENKYPQHIHKMIKSYKDNEYQWAKDFIYGIEKDYRLAKTAKVNCFLNGDGEANVIHGDGLDSFTKSTDYNGILKKNTAFTSKDNQMFDVLVANPPYSVESFKNTLNYGNESFELYNRLNERSSEIECLFVERVKQLLKVKGYAGIILPVSILNNTGIYADTREIILKYFKILSIVEFGSNTFMATGTNTITLFLQRRKNSDWQIIDSLVEEFFKNPKDMICNGIENAFSKYVDHVFRDITLEDYLSFIKQNPNDSMRNSELYIDYCKWFNELSEVKNLKSKTDIEKEDKLKSLFYDKVISIERKKLLYFMLSYPQTVILVKAGEKQKEKDFLGYEFSNRRGHEGIKLFRDENDCLTTKLYDDSDKSNKEKINSYIYRACLNQVIPDIDNQLHEHIQLINLHEMMDFQVVDFYKTISLSKKNENINNEINAFGKSTSTMIRFGELATLKYGSALPERDRVEGIYPVIGSNGIIGYHNNYIVEGPVIVVGRKGSVGKITLIKENCWPIDTTFYVEVDKNKFDYKFMYYILRRCNIEQLSNGMGVPGLNRNNVHNLRIPYIPLVEQQKVVSDIEKINTKNEIEIEKIEKFQRKIEEILSNLYTKYPTTKLKNLVTINPSKSKVATLPDDTSISFISMESLSTDGYVINTENKNLCDVKKGYTFFENGDVLVAKITPCMENGKCAIVNNLNNKIGFGSTEFYVLRSNDSILNKLLYYLIRRESFRNEAKKHMTGASGHRRVPKTFMENYDLPLINSIQDQHKIIEQIELVESQIMKILDEIRTRESEIDVLLNKNIYK